MPRYDIACGAGHLFEVFEDRETVARVCPQCREPARRVISAPGINGLTPKPTREHYVNVGRAMEAQHELVHQAERAHVPMPDLWKVAQDRVRRGDAVAIE